MDAAITSAVKGATVMANLSGYQRFAILRKAADLIEERQENLARTIEEGKTIAEARTEVSRAVHTISLSGEEAKRLHGETVPLDGAPGQTWHLAFTLRVPCGVVAAIAPFNFPLNLVCHKVGPALAAGNSVIIKPASDTPLSALKLTEILLEVYQRRRCSASPAQVAGLGMPSAATGGSARSPSPPAETSVSTSAM